MKKNLNKVIIALALIAACSTPVLAANDGWTDPAGATGVAISDANGTQGPGLTYDTLKFSANVQFYYASDTTNGNYFGLATFNTKGTKVYASNSNSSKIYATVADKDPTSFSSIAPVASGAWVSSTWAEVGK